MYLFFYLITVPVFAAAVSLKPVCQCSSWLKSGDFLSGNTRNCWSRKPTVSRGETLLWDQTDRWFCRLVKDRKTGNFLPRVDSAAAASFTNKIPVKLSDLFIAQTTKCRINCKTTQFCYRSSIKTAVVFVLWDSKVYYEKMMVRISPKKLHRSEMRGNSRWIKSNAQLKQRNPKATHVSIPLTEQRT